MSFVEVLLIALGLAMDAFAVCLGAGTTRHINGPRPVFRLSFHFGLFQALMPVLGWLVGSTVQRWIAPFDHWIAFALLAFVGVRMIRSGLDANGEAHATDPSRGATLIMLSVATSIDALAVGLSLAVLSVGIIYPAIVIGIVAGGHVAARHLPGRPPGQGVRQTYGGRRRPDPDRHRRSGGDLTSLMDRPVV